MPSVQRRERSNTGKSVVASQTSVVAGQTSVVASQTSVVSDANNGISVNQKKIVPHRHIEDIIRSEPIHWRPPRLHIELDIVQIGLFIIAIITRFYQISYPRAVLFDELHYTKYIGLYLNGTFFFDGHPPLAKLLYASIGYFSGYNMSDVFSKIGQTYSEAVPVVQLRTLPALFNCLTIPLIYQIMVELKLSRHTAFLAGLCVLCENSFLTQSRVMMAESILIFMMSFVLYSSLKLVNHLEFSLSWWLWLVTLGLGIGVSLSVKYISVLTFIIVMIIIGFKLWLHLADEKKKINFIMLSAMAQVCMITLLSLTLYITVFYIHLSILTKAGSHDNIMTSRFQASLEGGLRAITQGQPPTVAYGSQITLRHTYGQPCWLHSHAALYPVRYPDGRGSSHQQQVTCYTFKDVNNWWLVKHPEKNDIRVDEPVVPVRHGDIIELVHGMTKRKLNSHDVAAPKSPSLQEVSGYIDYNISMAAKTLWRVEILNADSNDGIWNAIRSHIRLQHVNSTQTLRGTGKNLPEWAFNQQEVATDKVNHDSSIWNVEEHKYTITSDKETEPKDKDIIDSELIPTQSVDLGFWEKFGELQWKMLTKSDKPLDHRFASKPSDWPTASGNIAYWLKSGTITQIHLLGNVVSWISALIGIFIQASVLVYMLVTRARNICLFGDTIWEKCRLLCAFSTGGYLLHYIPFHLIENTYFLYHYLPALLYKLMILPMTFELAFTLCGRHVGGQYALIGLLYSWSAVIVYNFYSLLSLCYGSEMASYSDLNALKWRATWDFLHN